MTEEAKERPRLTFEQLPRGGTLVEGPDFRLQIGAYPETIKDTMKSERGVPDLYLLPDVLFDTYLGVSNSDLEFPVYFNYFIKGKVCRIVCHRHQLKPIFRVLREAVTGPFRLYLEKEYPQGRQTRGFPDLQREMHYYKEDPKIPGGRLRLKHMVEFTFFDEDGKAEIDNYTISSLGRSRYRFSKSGETQECEFKASRETSPPTAANSDEPEHFFSPPVFGVTVIGSGHGFDADSRTAGFILWLNGKGILVDPPVDSTIWMKQNKVNTRLIGDLILTHCHADHDSGTLQKVLEEGRIRVHSTETVMNSFVAKYSALTGLKAWEFKTLFEFRPLRIGVRCTIAGARFLFKYNLHPIPTLGFEVELEGESFYYSCDTLYDPDIIAEWHHKGVLSKERMEDLLDVPWQSSLILHEAGIPPIHTPLSVLAALPEQVKKNMFLVHVSESAIPPDSGLKVANPGTENTLEIKVPTPQKSLAYKILDVVCNIDLFSDMKFEKALECLAITHYCVLEAEEVFIKRDTYGDKFYMILSGEVEVLHESLPRRVFFSRYDYIGETAIILNKPRNADIVTRTRTELLYIDKEDFLRFVRDTALPAMLKRLDENRSFGALWTFEKHRILSALSPLQKNQLMCSMLNATIPKNAYLYKEGDKIDWYYLIAEGEVRVRQVEGEITFGPGSLVGEFGPSFEVNRHSTEAQALTPLSVFKISAEAMKDFFRAYPGTFVRITKSLSDILKQNSFTGETEYA